ncbi:hypothetical protein JTE90_000619 [Oedothorax gibbosus]|uniref:Uncharacterized protein n=1 Tax=Oedothorax gibbosus TaxID=931172 RepID=A0AAV6VYB6_9ARAC|nr:hypothetical protein JTE90_000619 [Oedothorax gibbosus]
MGRAHQSVKPAVEAPAPLGALRGAYPAVKILIIPGEALRASWSSLEKNITQVEYKKTPPNLSFLISSVSLVSMISTKEYVPAVRTCAHYESWCKVTISGVPQQIPG